MVTAGAVEVVTVIVVVVVVVEGATEELLLSSLETGTAQTAAPIILQADKHATSVVLTNEHYPSQTLCQERLCRTLCRLAGLVLAELSAWLWVQLGCLRCWCPSLGFGCAGWLLGSWLNCLGCGTCFSSGFPCWLWQGVEWCDRLAAGCSGSCFSGKVGKCLDLEVCCAVLGFEHHRIVIAGMTSLHCNFFHILSRLSVHVLGGITLACLYR